MVDFTSEVGFVRWLQAVKTVPDGTSTSLEEFGTGDGSTSIFYISKIGIITGTYTLYYGATAAAALSTPLTETTHYTIDLYTSRVTLTSAGRTLVSTNKLYAAYTYNTLGLTSAEITAALESAEAKIYRRTDMKFVDGTVTNPGYRKVVNEVKDGGYDARGKTFESFWGPIVPLETTVNGAYTTGGTSLVLTSATGFPNAGTIYVGGNKVAYTAKSSNTLTVPSSTPSIASGAVVRGEVVEVSKEAEGNSPSYTVLDPDTDYKIDFFHHRIQLLDNAFFGELSSSDVIYPSNFLIRLSYMTAWYEPGDTATSVPDEIADLAYMIAARKMAGRIVMKAHGEGLNDYNPKTIGINDAEIDEILEGYSELNVGTSPYNRQNIS